jgi:hypothetical protein
MGHGRLLDCMKTGSRRPRRTLAGVCCGVALVWSSIASAGVWTTHGPNGGEVNAIAVDPSTPTTVYAATEFGGFFKSLDGGETWSPIGGSLTDPTPPSLTGIAVDPVTPTRVYATARVGLDGGLYRSTDAGASWSFTRLGVLNAVAIDPATPSTIYAVGDGIRKSSDAGANWTEVQTFPNFACVAIAPSSPSTVYAGGLKSTDGGATWKTVFSNSGSVLAVAIHPTMPNIVYLGVDDAGVFKTVDDGKTWTPIGPDVGGRTLTVRALAIDPTNPETVYAAGLTINGGFSVYKTTNGGATWTSSPITVITQSIALDPATPTTVFAGTLDFGVWRSTDGAASWNSASTGLANTFVHALAVDATPGTVYAAADRNGIVSGSTVARSTDGGATWAPTASIDSGLSTLLAVATDPSTPGTAYVGTSLNGVFKTVDGGQSWSPLPGGDASSPSVLVETIVVDPSSPSTVYAGGLGGAFVSTVGGASWTAINTGLPEVVISMAIDPTKTSTLYAGTLMEPGAGIFKTTNAGGMWVPINTGLPMMNGMMDPSLVTALAIDPMAPNTLYAAVEFLGVYKTTDGGASWAAASNGLPSLRVAALAVDPAIPNTVFAGTLDQGVFVSVDGGASWASMNDGLFNRSIGALAVERDRIYAGSHSDGAFAMPLGPVITTTSTSTTTSSTTSTTLQPVILGKTIEIKDPNPADPSRRQVVVVARELASSDGLDPATVAANGATLVVEAAGERPSSQEFSLPAPWTLLGTTGVRYVDSKGLNGQVKLAQLSKTTKGTFELKLKIQGKVGPGEQPLVLVVPPNPGTEATVFLQVNGGAGYCVAFGGPAGGQIANKGATSFKVTNPTEQICLPPG